MNYKSMLCRAIELSLENTIIPLLQAHPPLGLIRHDNSAYPIVGAVKNPKLSLSTTYEMLEIIPHKREMFAPILTALQGGDVDAE